MEIGPKQLVEIIGHKEVEIYALRAEVARLRELLQAVEAKGEPAREVQK